MISAKSFIKKYCRNTDSKIIEHGVNLDKFIYSTDKKDYFVVWNASFIVLGIVYVVEMIIFPAI